MSFLRSISWVILLVSLYFLQACGFQLRGDHRLPAHLSPIAIQGLAKHDELSRELAVLFQQSNIQLTRDVKAAKSVLRISNHQVKNRVLSVDDRAKSAEYELYERVDFELTTSTKNTLVNLQKVGASRTYINTSSQVLGKELEAKMLRRDLRRDLANRIISRIKAQLQ